MKPIKLRLKTDHVSHTALEDGLGQSIYSSSNLVTCVGRYSSDHIYLSIYLSLLCRWDFEYAYYIHYRGVTAPPHPRKEIVFSGSNSHSIWYHSGNLESLEYPFFTIIPLLTDIRNGSHKWLK